MLKKFPLVVLSIFTFGIQAQNKPLQIEKITKNLYTYTTYQTFNGTLYSSNALYLVTEEGVVLFDTPWDKQLNQPLLDSIQQKHQLAVVKVFATHWHEDRAGGFDFFNRLGIDTYASQKTNQKLAAEGLATATHTFKDEAVFTVGKDVFELLFVGEGHTFDNIVVWFPKQSVLDGGCLVKSSAATDLGYIGEANLEAWPTSIINIQKRFKSAKFIIPGHDNWQGQGHLEHTLKLLKQQKSD